MLYYGLTNNRRVVLGNTETGERATLMGAIYGTTVSYDVIGTTSGSIVSRSVNAGYAYPGSTMIAAAATPTNAGDAVTAAVVPAGLELDMKTGLEEFGHLYNVWYDRCGGGIHKTYAAYDLAKAEIVEGVYANNTLNDNAAVIVGEDIAVGTSAHLSVAFNQVTYNTPAAFPTTALAVNGGMGGNMATGRNGLTAVGGTV